VRLLTASAIVSLFGVAAFVFIVSYLHAVQKGYDPVHQLMSELALGRNGELMLTAFFSLAVSLSSLAVGTGIKKYLLLSTVLTVASICFLGAGMFTLGATSELHIFLVAVAFVAVGVSMYILPSYAEISQRHKYRQYSWGLLSTFVLSVGIGGSVVPMGAAQRCAALAMLLWVAISAWKLTRS
jgi:Protein of unknown function (DUF998)